jgi:CRISPR-associated protein Csx10
MKAVPYRVYLEQPLLATQLLGDPNSSVSFDYIPGSQVRGLLIHRYIERNDLTGTDVAGHPECRRLFFSGATRYLHAYLLTESEQRGLPTPLALLQRKSDDLGPVYNASHEDWNEEERRAAEDDDTLKPLDRPFCVISDGDRITLHKPQPNRIAVHVLRERVRGRATREKGAVFRYDALAEGQWFGGVVLVDDDTDTSIIRDLLQPETAWLGRSRSAGYGKVRILADPERGGDWREIGGAYPTIAANQHSTLTLLSDTILRDLDGFPVSSLAQQEVAHEPTADDPRLILDDQILSAYLGKRILLDATHSFSASVEHGGFNRTWQLPVAQTYALKAGSVIVFEPQETLDAETVRRLEQQGIGERRAEGFGRVAFNWLHEVELDAVEGQPHVLRDTSPSLSPMAQGLAQRMAMRLLEQQIEQGIITFVRDKVLQVDGVVQRMPQNSQLGRVRVLVRRAIRNGHNPAIVRDGLKQFKATGKQQFEQARLQDTSLWIWLNGLLAEPTAESQDEKKPNMEDVWEKLSLSETQWPRVVGQRAQRDAALTHAVTLRLIDTVMAGVTHARRKEQSR